MLYLVLWEDTTKRYHVCFKYFRRRADAFKAARECHDTCWMFVFESAFSVREIIWEEEEA